MRNFKKVRGQFPVQKIRVVHTSFIPEIVHKVVSPTVGLRNLVLGENDVYNRSSRGFFPVSPDDKACTKNFDVSGSQRSGGCCW